MAAANVTCELDSDCPDELTCLWNRAPLSSFCDCHDWYGRFGPQCDGWGPSAMVLVLPSVAFALFSAVALVPTTTTLIQVFRVAGVRALRRSAVSTLLFVTLATASLMVNQTTYALEGMFPLREGSTMEQHADGKKRSVFKKYSAAAFVSTATFTFMALLNVSVLWLEVSDRNRKMQLTSSKNIARYRTFCQAFGVLYCTIELAAALMQKIELGPFLSLPLTLPLCVLFIVGRRRIVAGLRMAAPTEGAVSGEVAQRVAIAIRGVNDCSLQVQVGFVLNIASSLLLVYMDMVVLPKFVCRPEKLCPSTALAQVCFLSMLILCLSIGRYSVVMAKRQLHTGNGRRRGVAVAAADHSGPISATSALASTSSS